MKTSWLQRLLKRFRPPSRPARKKIYDGRFLLNVESLDERVLPSVTATFNAAGAELRVVGDELDNTIVVSRNAAGTILVNNGAVAIQGGPATVANTRLITLLGQAGNDNLSLDETNGALPAANISGGDGNDTLTGGSGNDFIDGGTGADTAFLGAGDDTFQWDPGDGSDVVEGQGGNDTLVFNGSAAAENFDVSANGNRVRFTRDVGTITMDLNGIETIDLNANGGADTVTANDLSATNVSSINLDLGRNAAGAGDGQADAVILNGTDGDDLAQISFDGSVISANASLFPVVNITGAEAANDTLTVNALGGNDVVDASNLPANVIGLTVNGGAGNDTILGSHGNDLVNGGPGADVVRLGDGDDTFVWNPGDGSDTVDGQAGFDTMVFNGANVAEKFDLAANGNRVRFTRDVGAITMDLGGIEEADVNALGGADTITVHDLTGTDLIQANVNLNASTGGGDGQTDAVVVNGTNGDDTIHIAASGDPASISVAGLLPKVNITGAEAANDTLTVNALGGNDVVDISGLPANLLGLTVNLGDGQTVATTTTLSPSTATAVFGQTELLTATVTSQAATPTGTVTFLDGGKVLGSAPVNAAGRATLTVSLGVGPHALTASFAGVGGFADSTSAAAAVTVNPATGVLHATASRVTATPGVAFTGTVAAFTDTDPNARAGDFTVTITWGDGHTSAGTVTADGRGGFLVSGTNTYAAPGKFTVSTSIRGKDGSATAVSADALVGNANQRFLAQVYEDLLRRAVDPAGLAFWEGLLNGGVSRAQVVRGITLSPEFRTDQVAGLYSKLLHRALDAAGRDFFVGLLNGGTTLEQVAAIIAASPEYAHTHGADTADHFLDALYQDALGRAVDAAGRSTFDQAFAQGASPGQIASVIFGSDEFHKDLVENFYQSFLRRAGDDAGVSLFASAFQQGARDEDIIAVLAGSDEYFRQVS